MGYPTLLQRAIENLIRNAVKYTRPASEVSVCVARQCNSVTIQVRDQGDGIPADKIESITEPFVRIKPLDSTTDDTSASPNKTPNAPSGFGLGLAIAKRAVNIHHGELVLANHHEGGLVATVTIPTQTKELANSHTS